MISGIHQGAVQGNQITFCQKLFQRNIFHEILQGGIFVNIIGDYLHAEALADTAHCRTDFSRADDTGGFPVEVKAHQSI